MPAAVTAGMERPLGFVLGLALLVGSARGAGCAGVPEAPAPFARMEEDEADAELRALDFGSDELVGDEGTDGELADPNLILPEEDREGLAAEDVSELTDLDDLEADDGVDDELTGDAPPAPLSPASLSPASFGASSLVPSASPLGVPTDRTWFAQKFACQGNAKNCVCRGSKHNCQREDARHAPGAEDASAPCQELVASGVLEWCSINPAASTHGGLLPSPRGSRATSRGAPSADGSACGRWA